MRFARKVSSQGNVNLRQRVYMLVYGSALILLFILIKLEVNINSENSVVISINSNDDKVVDPIRIMGMGPTKSESLLNSPNAIKNLPPCIATLQQITSPTNFNDTQLALFSGWDVPAISKWGDRTRFQDNFGYFMQYIKGRDVQILKDKRGNQCETSTRSLIKAMKRLGIKQNIDLLFFTNDKENPDFLHGISDDYSIPPPLDKLETFEKGFKVFSAMEKGSSHPFHFHDAAWLGQVSGSRLWFFLPPGTSKKVVGKKVNGCDYLLGHSPLPKGVSVCLQEQANVMYLPPQWLHATCALEPWSVGVGGQGGDPSMYHQKFDRLESKLTADDEKDEVDKKFIECGVFAEDKAVREEN